jgi:hypothetical protein
MLGIALSGAYSASPIKHGASFLKYRAENNVTILRIKNHFFTHQMQVIDVSDLSHKSK